MSEVAGAKPKSSVVIRYQAQGSASLTNRFAVPFTYAIEVVLDVDRKEAATTNELSAWQGAVLHLVLDRPLRDPEQGCDVLTGVGRLKFHPHAAKHCFEEGIE